MCTLGALGALGARRRLRTLPSARGGAHLAFRPSTGSAFPYSSRYMHPVCSDCAGSTSLAPSFPTSHFPEADVSSTTRRRVESRVVYAITTQQVITTHHNQPIYLSHHALAPASSISRYTNPSSQPISPPSSPNQASRPLARQAHPTHVVALLFKPRRVGAVRCHQPSASSSSIPSPPPSLPPA